MIKWSVSIVVAAAITFAVLASINYGSVVAVANLGFVK